MTRTTAARAASQLPDFLDEPDVSSGAAATLDSHGAPGAHSGSALAGRSPWLLAAGCVVGAVVFAAWPAAATALGVAPGALLACAAAFAAGAATQARFGGELARLTATAQSHGAELSALHAQIAASGGGGGGSQGEGDLHQVLLALQKQDEKTGNLTRAVKMYGQPLVEISGQTTEIVAAMQQLQQSIVELAARPSAVSFEPVTQTLTRIEVNLAAIAQRLDDAEARKSLFRLEESTQKGLAAIAELQKGAELRQIGKELQERIDRAAATLADGMHKLGENNVGELAVVVRDIQREVTGVATQVAQINAAVKNAPRLEAPAAAAPPAPPAPPQPAPPTEGAAPSGNGGGGGYQTGARSSSGRNVLGAIARLKQMKG